jgi:hypothetical protein
MVVPATPVVTLPASQPLPASVLYQGLDIDLAQPMRRNNGLLVQGTIANTTSQVQTVPAMQAMLQDANGGDVQRWVFHPPVNTLARRTRRLPDRSAAGGARCGQRERHLRAVAQSNDVKGRRPA